MRFYFSFLLLLLLSCSKSLVDHNGDASDIQNFTAGETCLYQLQDAITTDIIKEKFPWVIMDYSKTGEAATAYSTAEIQSLIDSGITPLAYISIGEAEDYRFYWHSVWVSQPQGNDFTDKAPQWLGHTNPDWPGNYKVRYWNDDWRNKNLKPYLDEIILQGFKGVYLDIIDAFEYWGDAGNYGGKNGETALTNDPVGDEAEAAQRMINLVKWIASYCRDKSVFGEDFLIFPQNGERILDYDTDHSYLETISGLGREDIWYSETNENSARDVKEILGYLRQFIKNGKTVIAVDYVDDGSGLTGQNLKRILDFASKCKAERFRYYIGRTDRNLDMINVIENVQP
ncbi:MAG: hypothetical protein GWP06_11140 [Actinobacteria bacterium]|nr:hypothetical protein [Actinomycetota bacterium]